MLIGSKSLKMGDFSKAAFVTAFVLLSEKKVTFQCKSAFLQCAVALEMRAGSNMGPSCVITK